MVSTDWKLEKSNWRHWNKTAKFCSCRLPEVLPEEPQSYLKTKKIVHQSPLIDIICFTGGFFCFHDFFLFLSLLVFYQCEYSTNNLAMSCCLLVWVSLSFLIHFELFVLFIYPIVWLLAFRLHQVPWKRWKDQEREFAPTEESTKSIDHVTHHWSSGQIHANAAIILKSDGTLERYLQVMSRSLPNWRWCRRNVLQDRLCQKVSLEGTSICSFLHRMIKHWSSFRSLRNFFE